METRKELGRRLRQNLAYFHLTKCPVFFRISKIALAQLGRTTRQELIKTRQDQTQLFKS